jgi:hypothetical protein
MSAVSCIDILPPPVTQPFRAHLVLPEDSLFPLPIGGEWRPVVRVLVEGDTVVDARLIYRSLDTSVAYVDSNGTLIGASRGRTGVEVRLAAGAAGDPVASDTLSVWVVIAGLRLAQSARKLPPHVDT